MKSKGRITVNWAENLGEIDIIRDLPIGELDEALANKQDFGVLQFYKSTCKPKFMEKYISTRTNTRWLEENLKYCKTAKDAARLCYYAVECDSRVNPLSKFEEDPTKDCVVVLTSKLKQDVNYKPAVMPSGTNFQARAQLIAD